jgi:hypothetical protein
LARLEAGFAAKCTLVLSTLKGKGAFKLTPCPPPPTACWRSFRLDCILSVTPLAELFDAIGVFRPVEDAVMLYSQADDLPWFALQLVRVSFDVEVLEPPELREAITLCAHRLLDQVKSKVL